MWMTLRQTKCLMYKNFLLKKRDKKQFLQELLYPVYMVGILAMIRAFVKPQEYPRITGFTPYSLDNIFTTLNMNGTLIFAPKDNPKVVSVVNNVNQLLSMRNPAIGFVNATELDNYYIKNSNRTIIGGIIFDSFQQGNISYTIRFPENTVPSTTITIASNRGFCRNLNKSISSNCPANLYLTSGFALLQNVIDHAIMMDITGQQKTIPLADYSFKLMPKDVYVGGVSYIQIFVSIYFVMAYSPFVNFLLVGLVTEKEKKIKEGMKMMGLRTSAFWLSWFCTYAITIFICTLIVTIIAAVAQLYAASNPVIIFCLLFFYGLSVVTLSFMLTPFFNKATVAGAVGSLATVAFTALYFPVTLLATPPAAKWVLSLLSPVALALSLTEATALETSTGAQFNNLGAGQFPIGGGLIMLLVDTGLYLLLAVYFDMIVPKEYGQRYHPLFCFTTSYWRGQQYDSSVMAMEEGHLPNKNADLEDISEEYCGKEAIRIVGITKSFEESSSGQGSNQSIAVDNFSLEVYEGQITALLGHNGAGKTTLIATLTGLLPTTRGTAYIYNNDINVPEQMAHVREITGVCPQHDILFDTLSPREHLTVFATIKGIPNNQIAEAVNKTLQDVLLTDKADTRSSNLSGGQKRKLSVGIAIIGDPKVVYLDEPTSGMDPLSRRQIWSLLQNRREGRVTLLTTHFMDEADILADRKAVMSRGKLRCAGSSLFLKNRFGIGYHLGMVTTHDSRIDEISRLVKSHIPKAKLQRSHAGEVSYLLPLSDVPQFPDLFTHLESPASENSIETCAAVCGISSYGISMTTLEEVFLKLKDDDSEDFSTMVKGPLNDTNVDNEDEILRSTSVPDSPESPEKGTFNFSNTKQLSIKELVRQQFMALFTIRFLVMRRDPLSVFFRIVLPPVFIVLGLIFANNISSISNGLHDPPVLKFVPEMYLNGTSTPSSQKLYANLLIKNSSSENIDWFINLIEKRSLYYRMSNLSDDYLLDHHPHTIGIDVTEDLRNITQALSAGMIIEYNDTAYHSIPIAINVINQIRLNIKMNQHKGTAMGSNSIYVSSKPLPKATTNFGYNSAAMAAPLFIGLSLNVIPAGFAIEVTRDRKDNIRQLLRASGVTSAVYWLSLFACDLVSFLFPVIVMFIIIPIMNVAALVVPAAMGVLVMATLTYVQANILFAYVASYIFSSVETCQSVLPPVLNILFLLPTIGISLLDMLGQPTAALVVHGIMLAINPTYPIGGALYYMSKVYLTYQIFFHGQPIPASAYFSPSSPIPYCILSPVIHSLLLFWLLRYLDYRKVGSTESKGCFCTSRSRSASSASTTSETAALVGRSAAALSEDDDVRAEYERITETRDSNNAILKVQRLRKEFIKATDKQPCCSCCAKTEIMTAVEDLYFGVQRGEIFGLLGPNGAGKTTTLNIITGDMAASRGEVSVAGYELGSEITRALRSLGFCPQHDALWERVTLSEHLHAYAAIKGVPKDCIHEAVSRFIAGMDIQEHAMKYAKKLSGGTKRKLSFGMSIIGCPRLILMDEPSTGMDPGAKRFLWNSITASITGETAAVITTHSMEEADALCSRVGIMVRGQLRCLGSTQHLKNKYGGGYHLEVKFSHDRIRQIADNEDAVEIVSKLVKESYPSAELLEHFGQRIIFKIPSSDVKSLAKSFAFLEQGKTSSGIVEYSFSQSTLEQVFLEFAKKQDDEEDETSINKTTSEPAAVVA